MNTKKVQEKFLVHLNKAGEVSSELRDLEKKYPFFRVRVPEVSYNLTKDEFELEARLGLNLRAKSKADDDYFFSVGFNGGHDFLRFRSGINLSFPIIEAQESVRCDPFGGFYFVKKFFDTFAPEGKNIEDGSEFGVKLNGEVLIFDDVQGKHKVFRGWTGGYDPSYSYSDSPLNRPYLDMKREWSSDPMGSLEKRINTLKMLFDGINEEAKFEVEKFQPPIPFLDYKSLFRKNIESESFSAFLELENIIHENTKIDGRFEKLINISEDVSPEIVFYDSKSGSSMAVTYYGLEGCKYETKICLPASALSKKSFSRGVWSSTNYKTKEKTVCASSYCSSEEKIPFEIKKCLDLLIK